MSNPILQRELLTTLRSPRASVALVGTVGLLSTMVLLLWPAGGVYSLGEQASHTLLNSVSLGALLLSLLIAPSFTATCLTSEKENASYDLLTHTLLRPWEIAWGKIVSAEAYLVLLLISILPVMASTLFLGGTSSGDLALIFLVITCGTLTAGLLGFAVSSVSRESFSALVTTYAITLFWTTLPLLPPLLLRDLVANAPLLGAVAYCSPLTMMLQLVEPDLFLTLSLPISPKLALPIYLSSCGVISLFSWFLGTIRILRHQTGAPNRPGSQKKAKSKFPLILIDPQRRKSLIGNWTNPVLAKEFRSKTFGQAQWIIRGVYATLTVSLLLVGLMVKGGAGVHLDVLKLAMIAFQVLVVILLVPALLSGAVTQELEQKQFDLLRQTLLRPHTLLLGKAISAWLLVVLLLVASVPMWWMLAYLENYQWVGTLVSMAVVAATLVMASSVALASTTLARTTAVSTAMAYVFISIVAFGTLTPLLMGDRLSAEWRTAILCWNPFASGLQVVSTELLRNEGVLWKRFLANTLGTSVVCFTVAWLMLWKKLRREN